MRSAGITLLALTLGAGCSTGAVETSTTLLASTGFQISWTTQSSLTDDQRTEIESALRWHQGSVLVPSLDTIPSMPTDLVYELALLASGTDGGGSIDLIVRRSDGGVHLSVQSSTSSSKDICAPLLSATPASWLPRTIRGISGCALPVPDAVSYLAWSEGGQQLVAQFGPEVAETDIIDWLATWTLLEVTASDQ